MVITRIHIVSMMLLTLIGVVILSLSLIAANSLSSTGSYAFSGGLRLYYTREILPDHMLYPFLRLRDRVRLQTASPQEKISLELQYAEHRYEVADKLLNKGQNMLAISTFSKSQKYLISAAYQALEDPQTDTKKVQEIRLALDHSLYRLNRFSDQYDGSDEVILSQLKEDTEVLIKKYDEFLSK